MFIGQRSTASMSAPVYTQTKWLKNLSTMGEKKKQQHKIFTLFTLFSKAKLWQHKPMYQTFHKKHLNHKTLFPFAFQLLGALIICHVTSLVWEVLLQIPFSVNIQELTHILGATYFSSQVANWKEKQDTAERARVTAVLMSNSPDPIVSLRCLLKSCLAWLTAQYNHYERLCQQDIY